MDKRGQGLSTNAIVLIILAVVVLAVLIVGFTMGWDKLAPWLSSNNVDTIKTQCAVACSTSDTYGFCTEVRTLKADDLPTDATGKGSCDVLSKAPYTAYGIEDCTGITC